MAVAKNSTTYEVHLMPDAAIQLEDIETIFKALFKSVKFVQIKEQAMLYAIFPYRIRKATINERLKTAPFFNSYTVKWADELNDDERNNDSVRDAFKSLQAREQR